jgi:hypothetical protein
VSGDVLNTSPHVQPHVHGRVRVLFRRSESGVELFFRGWLAVTVPHGVSVCVFVFFRGWLAVTVPHGVSVCVFVFVSLSLCVCACVRASLANVSSLRSRACGVLDVRQPMY